MSDQPTPATADLGRRGHYRLVRVLGEGGMGRVYLAFDERFPDARREVALKEVLPGYAQNGEVKERFWREVRAMQIAAHPHIVPILDVGNEGDHPYFVMPRLFGETLKRRLDGAPGNRLPIPEAIRIGRETAEGLAHAHSRALIHRDIKPENLWLEADNGRVKILDFGLARLQEEGSALTRTGQGMGTYGYVAPEQLFDASKVDPRCDQYGLGAILYQVCTGILPVGRFSDPDQHNPAIPSELTALILRLLAPSPEGRFARMVQVAESLSAIEAALRSRPPGPALRVVRLGEQGSHLTTESLPDEVVDSAGMRFRLIPAGTFCMGSPEGELGRFPLERLREVTISRPFYLGKYPVTQGEYQTITGHDPAWFSRGGGGGQVVLGLDTDQLPVEQVSWDDVQAFLQTLNSQPQPPGSGWYYRLPTEAEWEYACRGGTTVLEPYHTGTTISYLQANLGGHLGHTSEVGSYPPNGFGLHDMHGNVWEWCADWYAPYPDGPVVDPVGSEQGQHRVFRGGSWCQEARHCRSAQRDADDPWRRFSEIGFRVVLVLRGERVNEGMVSPAGRGE